MRTAVVLISVLGMSGGASAEEKKIAESGVPKPVIEKVKKKYPAAKLTSFELENENGKSSYEVKLTDGKKELEVVCSPDGKILAEEEKIAADAVPDVVLQALKSNAKFGTWTLETAERVVFAEKVDAPSYELKVVKGKLRAELVFTGDGKLTKTEESAPQEKKHTK